MLTLLYDAFELQKMGEYSDDSGGVFHEPFEDDGDPDDECLRVFWTVFGHYTLPKHGRNSIGDFNTLKEAGEVFDFLCMLLDSHKKLHKLMEMLK